jgi:poly-gamma-glutamate synthesis protein (capsule biosynthesis protein)
MFSRRELLCSLALSAAPGIASTPELSVAICGQSLLEFNLTELDWPGRDELRCALQHADAAFTDFEGTVRGPRAGTRTRNLETLHAPTAASLDLLKSLGLSLYATANNHAFDLGTGGVLDTIDAMLVRDLVFAGTGRTLAEASAPAVFQSERGNVGLVAAAAGAIRPGGAATSERAGVNELRLTNARQVEPEDQARYLGAISSATRLGGPVIAYLHNHDWEPDNADTPQWQRGLARAAVDAGASVFVSHGPPLLHGIELYKGAPLFHGLGSLFFQTRKAGDAYGPLNWQAAIAHCRFAGPKFSGAELYPWQLAADGVAGPHASVTRGVPRPALPQEAATILEGLVGRSARLGLTLEHNGLFARITPG